MYNDELFIFGGNFYDNKLKFDFLTMSQVCEVAISYGNSVPFHKQVCNEITYTISGGGIFCTGDERFSVSQGDIHIVSKGDTHEILVPDTQNLRYICIGFDFESVPEEYQTIRDFYSKSPDMTVKDEGDLKFLFEMLIREFYVKDSHRNCVVENLLKLILLKVKRAFERKEEYCIHDRGMIKQSTFYKILKYVDDNIDSICTVSEISKNLHYTESYISSLFQKTMGITLQSYVREKKLETAKVMLEYGNQTVSEVAHRMNFDNAQTFSKSFKKKYGITPNQYILRKRKETCDDK